VVCSSDSSVNVSKDLKRQIKLLELGKLRHVISLVNISVNFHFSIWEHNLTEDDKISSPLEEASFSEFVSRRGRWFHWLQRAER
jgi:hypothetical protein